MPIQLRDYQADMEQAIQSAWGAIRYILSVLPTGGGKTVLFAEIIRKTVGAVCAVAHRQELVGQISLALARDGIRHKIIGPKSVVKLCIHMHQTELGKMYYDPMSEIAVAGVDTLLRRGGKLGTWARSVKLWVMDEGHHVQKNNKWGKVIEFFPNARGLGVTATPLRADSRGLHSDNDGIYHVLLMGPHMRELIRRGYLTDYKIFAPHSDFNRETIAVSQTTGDFNPVQLRKAAKRSHIVGDVVDHYLRIAPGKLGVTFATDVETALNITAKFNAAGVPAEMVCAKTPDRLRIDVLRRFKRRELLQLVNVDIFGEGFDLPAIEVVSMARPTESYGLYVQQFGRALRIMDGKERAIIIDHVGNVIRHGLPDAPRAWSLGRREKRDSAAETGPLLRSCPKCTGVYERFYPSCPYCGHIPVPVARSSPEFVDGDLQELDAATLARMRGEVDNLDRSPDEYKRELSDKRCPPIGVAAHVKQWRSRQEAQRALRTSMGWWAAFYAMHGASHSEIDRRFYHGFGIDRLTAQTLGESDTLALAERINNTIGGM
jgi:superfamily II DNA or RNA helicase